ncbi:phage replication-related protein YjqB (UPF0714/DUF867 family) [Bacillus sp. RC242]|uniref:poly-gamma-glutamate hydrolase family protein n=1 Tax=Bacillus sp. RC242 TaxID=3156286 RepID=UPI003834083B
MKNGIIIFTIFMIVIVIFMLRGKEEEYVIEKGKNNDFEKLQKYESSEGKEKPKGVVSYKSFADLKQNEDEGKDYRITAKKRNSEILVMAIHGGFIELGTDQVAKKLGEKLGADTYTFEALKPRDNWKLHIESTLYDEPKAIEMSGESKSILSIHGYYDEENENVYIGGRNKVYRKIMKDSLEEEGFSVELAPENLRAMNPDNIANRNGLGEGVQLELSTALRKSFFKNNEFFLDEEAKTTKEFSKFIRALEQATLTYKHEHLSNENEEKSRS